MGHEPVDPLETELEAIARHLRAELGTPAPPPPRAKPRSGGALVMARFVAAFLAPALLVAGMALMLGTH